MRGLGLTRCCRESLVALHVLVPFDVFGDAKPAPLGSAYRWFRTDVDCNPLRRWSSSLSLGNRGPVVSGYGWYAGIVTWRLARLDAPMATESQQRVALPE